MVNMERNVVNMEKNMVNMEKNMVNMERNLHDSVNTYNRAMNDKTILDTCRKTSCHHCCEYRNYTHTRYDPNDTEQTSEDRSWNAVTVPKNTLKRISCVVKFLVWDFNRKLTLLLSW